MALGRTTINNGRVYVEGFDMSGFIRTFGPADWTFDPEGDDQPCLTDPVKGALPGLAHANIGTISGVLDNTATIGMHIVLKDSDVLRNVMLAIGIRAAPAAGDPAFVGQFRQLAYMAEPAAGMATVSITFAGWDGLSDTLLYDIPWGHLLHAKAAKTGPNTADASDHDHEAQTAFGGFMMYQVFSSDGTVAIKVQDSSTEVNANYSDLLTSGDVDASATPASGIVALGKTATVERYTRWQIALNTATTVTFALAFVRAFR